MGTAEKLSGTLRLTNIIMLVAVVLGIVAVFLRTVYDWDLDHELYYGSRLLAGELIWTREFHDKLPLVPMLFTLPAMLGGIQVWRTMSLAACLLSALAMRRWTPRALGLPDSDPVLRGRIVDFGLLFILYCATCDIGQFTSINPASAFLAMLAMLLMLLTVWREGLSFRHRVALMLAGSLTAAVSISMRPYFAAPLAFTLCWAFAGALISAKDRKQPAVLAIGWGAAIGAIGFAVNVLPYVLAGRLDALRDGVLMNGDDVNGNPFLSSFIEVLHAHDLLTMLIFGTMGATTAAMLAGYRGKGRMGAAFAQMLGAAILLFLYIATKHWWPHYIHFFEAIAGIMVVILLAALGGGEMRPWIERLLIPALRIGLPLFALAATAYDIRVFVGIAPDRRISHFHAEIADAMESYRRTRPEAERSFLIPFDMYTHWRLREGRHGFPHAANTSHIFAGWWTNVGHYPSFMTPRNPAEYCAALMRQGPAIIATFGGLDNSEENAQIGECLSAPDSAYRLDYRKPLLRGTDMDFYVRR